MDLSEFSYFGTEGSGNQKKFWVGTQLIKLNTKYHEAEKEYSAGVLGKAFGLNIVEYQRDTYFYKNEVYKGCVCNSFLKQYESAITLAYILSSSTFTVNMNTSSKEYFEKVVNSVCTITNIKENYVKNYLLQIMTFDYIICNSDRHLSNIEFVYNKSTKQYRFAPIFDNGLSFLLKDGMQTKKQMQMDLYKFKTATFSRNPKTNLIDITIAKANCQQFVANAGGMAGIDALPINEWHKYLAKYRIKELLSL